MHFHHPVAGDMHQNFEVTELPADPGLSLHAFSADAGSRDAGAGASSPAGPPHDPADALKSAAHT